LTKTRFLRLKTVFLFGAAQIGGDSKSVEWTISIVDLLSTFWLPSFYRQQLLRGM
jgi:hypothetical protein